MREIGGDVRGAGGEGCEEGGYDVLYVLMIGGGGGGGAEVGVGGGVESGGGGRVRPAAEIGVDQVGGEEITVVGAVGVGEELYGEAEAHIVQGEVDEADYTHFKLRGARLT